MLTTRYEQEIAHTTTASQRHAETRPHYLTGALGVSITGCLALDARFLVCTAQSRASTCLIAANEDDSV